MSGVSSSGLQGTRRSYQENYLSEANMSRGEKRLEVILFVMVNVEDWSSWRESLGCQLCIPSYGEHYLGSRGKDGLLCPPRFSVGTYYPRNT